MQRWLPPRSVVGFEGDDPVICPGYTTSLPEVVETLRARTHWTRGSLAVFDPAPHENLVACVEILEANVLAFERWRMTPSKDGGGGG